MPRFVVSYDVDWDSGLDTEYERTRDALDAAIEALPHCLVLLSLYVVSHAGPAKTLNDEIRTNVARRLRGTAHQDYRLSVIPAGRPGHHYRARAGVVDRLNALKD